MTSNLGIEAPRPELKKNAERTDGQTFVRMYTQCDKVTPKTAHHSENIGGRTNLGSGLQILDKF
jgi:hypothetical protein